MSHRNTRWKSRARHAPANLEFERSLLDHEENHVKSYDPQVDRKTLQLCRQIQRALSLALSGECAHELLSEVYVESVTPMGSASQLQVAIMLPASAQGSYLDVLACLNDRAGQLRTVVAQSICRKKTPRLSFVILPAEDRGAKGGAS